MWQPQSLFNQFLLRTPTVLLGRAAIRGLYNYQAGRIAVIHGSSFFDGELLEETLKKKSVRFFKRSWDGEPDLSSLSDTVSDLENYQPDTIIACGGGSVIDGVKLCRALYEFPYIDKNNMNLGGLPFKTRFIAIPTTFGSGAEVSSAAVYVEESTRRKEMLVAHELQPDVVVYDPSYLTKMPLRLICASALDAAAHMIEGYVSNIENSFAEAIAESGLVALRGELSKLLVDRNAEIDFERLQYVGFSGGIVQNHCIVGTAHAVAHQLTGYGYSHGEAVALLLPTVIQLNNDLSDANGKYERLAERTGFDSVASMQEFLEKTARLGKIDERQDALKKLLTELISDNQFLSNVKRDRGGKGNPVEITDDYLKELIRRM